MAEQKTQSENTPEQQVVEGVYLPSIHNSWEDKIRQLRQMELRDDDVFLCVYPRSVAGIKGKRTKKIYVYRNPKDVCVSFFTLFNASTWAFAIHSDAFEQFFDTYFFSEKQNYGSYFEHLRKVHQFQQQNPEVPVLILSYEDTKKDPVGCVKKLAQFLCLTASDELCSQIAQACSFDNMKKQEAEKATPDFGDDVMSKNLKLDQQDDIFYRKGHIGDWKNHFTVAMNERVDDLIKQEMKDLHFTLTFE